MYEKRQKKIEGQARPYFGEDFVVVGGVYYTSFLEMDRDKGI